MDISTNSLYAQMQSMSLQAGGNRINPLENSMQINSMDSNAVPAVNSSASSFGNLLKDAVDNVNELQQNAGSMRNAFELGDRSVSLAQIMVAGQKSGIAFDATVQVRNKFLEAYKEIMSMPV